MSELAAALVQRGLPKHVAQAFVANAEDESGLRSDINERKPIVPGSRGGYGLMQWTGPRRKQLEAFAASRDVPVSDMGAQVDFLINELNTTEKRAASRIMATDNAADAAVEVMNSFLRPHKDHRPKREARYRQMFGGEGSDTMQGGAGNDRLEEVRAEIARRKRKAEVEAEIQRRKVAAEGPDPRDRERVEAALAEAGVIEGLPEKGIAEGTFDELTSGFAGNFGDELEAFERAVPALFNDDNFREQYQIALSEEREKSRKFADDNPVLATGANIAGAVATGLGAAKAGLTLTGATKTVPGAVGAGMGEGTAYGLIWGAGASEGDFEKNALDALASGAVGAVLGGAISGAIQKIANSGARAGVVRALKPTADLKVARDTAYQTVDALGATYAPKQVDALVSRIVAGAKRNAVNARLHKGAQAAMDYAETLRGRPATLTEIDQLRQIVARDAGGSAVPADKAFASRMIDQIDDFIQRSAPRNLNVTGAAGRDAHKAVLKARKAHSVFKKSELIDRILIEAADQAGSAHAGANRNNTIRASFKNLLKNDKKIRGFSAEEKGIMRRIVRGSKKDNVLRLVGRLSPSSGGLMSYLNAAAFYVNPASAVVSGASVAAKSAADKGTQRAVGNLQAAVQTGRDVSRETTEVTAQKRALFRTLASEFGVEAILPEPTLPSVPVQ